MSDLTFTIPNAVTIPGWLVLAAAIYIPCGILSAGIFVVDCTLRYRRPFMGVLGAWAIGFIFAPFTLLCIFGIVRDICALALPSKADAEESHE